jgi:hypothetical protein
MMELGVVTACRLTTNSLPSAAFWLEFGVGLGIPERVICGTRVTLRAD